MATAKHFKHLTFEMRLEIEDCVVEGRTLAYMAQRLDVDATSISRELKRNRRYDGPKAFVSTRNRCIHRRSCRLSRVCDPGCRKRRCASCAAACREGGCGSFEEETCARTVRAPWVCNGCDKRNTCPLERYTYSAKAAQAKADSRLKESREGVDMTGHEMARLAAEVRAGLGLGQSVHHIFASRDDLPCSERSFYRHVENEAIDVRKMELRKKVRYKKRSRRQKRHGGGFYAGREYADFLALDDDARARCVQIDCVEGAQGDEQAVLTLHFVSIRFQLYVLLERKDSGHVVAALDWLEGLLGGPSGFKRIFGLLLADRGSEFDDMDGIERGGRCSVYYTDPQRPDQKGGCEKNHVELRKIVPKGTSIDALGLDPWIMAGVCSHANSSIRLALGDASPMALAKAALPASLLEGLGLDIVAPDDVETRPELIERLKQERGKTSK